MLNHLSIQDVVLIEQVNLDLPNGMAAFTGETGAGKSIILDALGLALGQRSETRLIRQGCDKASVTAQFDIANPALAKTLEELLAKYEFPFTRDLILRRVLSQDGRSRAFLNDYPISIGLLKELGDRLVEIHGQFATQKLLEPKAHREILDHFAQHEKLLREVETHWTQWQSTQKKLQALQESIAQAQREQDYLEHSVSELRDLNPQDGEENELVTQRTRLQHAEKINQALTEAYDHLTADQGVRSRIHQSLRTLERIRDQAGDGLTPAIEALERIAIESDEAEGVLDQLKREIVGDGATQEKLDDRLFALRGAARKYQTTCDGLVAVLQDYQSTLGLLDDQSRDSAALTKQVKQDRDAYVAAAEKLGQSRQKSATQMAKAVMAELAPLKLDKARFTVQQTAKTETQWNGSGMDDIVFLLSTNPGSAPAPLHKIASGGEMARFMLALKVVTHAKGDTPTLIFDEVDTGIGGAVAAAVGARLRRLGEQAQVLVVTHSPQVAAHGHHHMLIEKQSDKKSTRTHVQVLEQAVRPLEIARMLAGAEITPAALQAAEHLLIQSQGSVAVKTKAKPANDKNTAAKTKTKKVS
jgi:DNA repair protein RecN (Recombination protein N)